MGEIVKHKARLVIKGCSQHLRFDFNETYLPVVQIETIQILLVMVPSLNLRLQQMDIKGAYLNGILKKTIYLKQLEGFFDRTDQVCRLNKTLYRLKQSGHEWNNQLDHGLQSIGFQHLLTDPCAYLQTSYHDFQIITVWVNDLLIFTTSNNGMKQAKDQIGTRWQVTNLGKPSKIIGIQIIRNTDSIVIT